MSNILIVSQKELSLNPIFKQDRNVLEIYNILKENNNIKVLYLHKNILNNEESKKETNKIENLQQFCIKDMIRKRLLKDNIDSFMKTYNIEIVIFASLDMAKFIIPYMEKYLNKLNIICDFRFSTIYSYIQDYKEAKEEKRVIDFKLLNRRFRANFLQILPILKYLDNIVLDDDTDIEVLKEKNINNVINVKKIKDFVACKKDNINIETKNFSCIDISITKNNYSSNTNFVTNYEDTLKCNLNENKNSNLIDDINNIIKNKKADCFFIHRDKIIFNKKTLDLLKTYLFINKNIALASPNIIYSREINTLQTQFDNQRCGNFSFWEEANPLSFFESVIIKKSFFHKVGFFDNNFKTFDYALFDFILRLYQIKAYCCLMHDISVFKAVKISHKLSLFEKDKIYLCKKWGESNFSMAI